jgi:hypothetical protein
MRGVDSVAFIAVTKAIPAARAIFPRKSLFYLPGFDSAATLF